MQIDIDSSKQHKCDLRLQQIKQWIDSDLQLTSVNIEVASADASFRRYFRLQLQGGESVSYIVMDAPPDKEDCRPFVKIAKLLESVGVYAPHIYDFNQAQGFMRLSDLGSTAYLDALNNNSVDVLYGDAIQAIVKMQKIKAELPAYNDTLLHTEMNLFKDWYLLKHMQTHLDESQQDVLYRTFNLLAENALQQPCVFVHRDYHSRNLMQTSENNPGVIDFQDAVNGPASYDLVSLIKDCYISWPRHKQLQWIDRYLQLSTLDIDKKRFIKQVDLMGMQRHLKATGIFARLNYRDNKPGYMKDIPRTLAYVFDVCERYTDLFEFSVLLKSLNIKPDQSLLENIQ